MPIASPAPTARSRTRLGLAFPRAGRRDAGPSVAGDRTGVTEGTLAGPFNEKAAAHRLGPSHSTVKQHLANARSKVGAETTAQLVWILAPRLPEPGGTVQATSYVLDSVRSLSRVNSSRVSRRSPEDAVATSSHSAH